MIYPDRKQLSGFIRVIELGSLSRAAESLNLSESALSRQISNLEEILQISLFSRDKRQMIPTDEGLAFLPEAERVLGAIHQLPEIARRISKATRRQFRIVVSKRLSHFPTVSAIKAFRLLHPDLDVSVDVESQDTFERWSHGHHFDLAIGPLPIPKASVDSILVAEVPMVIVVGKDHRLASARQVTLDDLEGETFAATSPGLMLRKQIDSLFAREHRIFSPSINFSVSLLACKFAAENDAVAFSDPFAPSLLGDEVAIIPIEPRYNMRFDIMTPANVSNALANDFTEILKSETGDYLNEIGLQ
ncbi:MAG: LysR family transcriptional regulator [Rhodospirillales bacterium]